MRLGFLPASRQVRQPLRPPNGATKTSDSGAGHGEGAYIRWREGSGRQALERAGLDGRKDMEAQVKKVGIDKLEEV